MTYGVVLVTAPSEAVGRSLARSLVEAKLAACVSLTPITSIYRWQDTIYDEPEWQLVIKTDLSQFEAIAAHVKSAHPYDVPEIIALPITAGLPAYLQWIGESTTAP